MIIVGLQETRGRAKNNWEEDEGKDGFDGFLDLKRKEAKTNVKDACEDHMTFFFFLRYNDIMAQISPLISFKKIRHMQHTYNNFISLKRQITLGPA